MYKSFIKYWIDKNGSLPDQYQIVHIDGNHQNNHFGNLKVVEV
jgi:outer membrane lipoprotein-sorting protein